MKLRCIHQTMDAPNRCSHMFKRAMCGKLLLCMLSIFGCLTQGAESRHRDLGNNQYQLNKKHSGIPLTSSETSAHGN